MILLSAADGGMPPPCNRFAEGDQSVRILCHQRLIEPSSNIEPLGSLSLRDSRARCVRGVILAPCWSDGAPTLRGNRTRVGASFGLGQPRRF
jgi:hypothetical protein